MLTPFSIEPQSGIIAIGDDVRLGPGQSKSAVVRLVAPWVEGARDFGNGYEWLSLRGLSFGGHAAALSLCFHVGHLDRASWGVELSNVASPGDWPSREEIDEEVAFVRSVLAKGLGFDPARSSMTFAWGEIWSSFDPKGCLAANGLRYGLLD